MWELMTAMWRLTVGEAFEWFQRTDSILPLLGSMLFVWSVTAFFKGDVPLIPPIETMALWRPILFATAVTLVNQVSWLNLFLHLIPLVVYASVTGLTLKVLPSVSKMPNSDPPTVKRQRRKWKKQATQAIPRKFPNRRWKTKSFP